MLAMPEIFAEICELQQMPENLRHFMKCQARHFMKCQAETRQILHSDQNRHDTVVARHYIEGQIRNRHFL